MIQATHPVLDFKELVPEALAALVKHSFLVPVHDVKPISKFEVRRASILVNPSVEPGKRICTTGRNGSRTIPLSLHASVASSDPVLPSAVVSGGVRGHARQHSDAGNTHNVMDPLLLSYKSRNGDANINNNNIHPHLETSSQTEAKRKKAEGKRRFAFSYGFLRDVVYQLLLYNQRRELHRAIGTYVRQCLQSGVTLDGEASEEIQRRHEHFAREQEDGLDTTGVRVHVAFVLCCVVSCRVVSCSVVSCSVCLPVCLSVRLCVCVSVCLSLCVFVCLSVRLSVSSWLLCICVWPCLAPQNAQENSQLAQTSSAYQVGGANPTNAELTRPTTAGRDGRTQGKIAAEIDVDDTHDGRSRHRSCTVAENSSTHHLTPKKEGFLRSVLCCDIC